MREAYSDLRELATGVVNDGLGRRWVEMPRLQALKSYGRYLS
jgi:hypothetical protein